MPTIGPHIITLAPADVGTTIASGYTVKSVHILGTAATAAGHQYRLEDPNGNLLYRSQANGAWYESESITQRLWFEGIKIVALDSGIIDLEIENIDKSKY